MDFRDAFKSDLDAIVFLLSNDSLGAKRENYTQPLSEEYGLDFERIQQQEGNSIIVAVENSAVIGCLQLIIIPGLARLGMTRAQIEGVRVAEKYRGQKVGEKLFLHTIQIAKARGCGLVQLTTDKERNEAHRFYDRLGFVASHIGMKLLLT